MAAKTDLKVGDKVVVTIKGLLVDIWGEDRYAIYTSDFIDVDVNVEGADGLWSIPMGDSEDISIKKEG